MLHFLRDPLQYVHANIGDYDLLHSSRDPAGHEANLGFYYVKATAGGKALLNATLATHIEKPKKWDQEASVVLGYGVLHLSSLDLLRQTCIEVCIAKSWDQTAVWRV